MNAPGHSYLREALTEPLHGFVLPASLLLAVYAVFSGRLALLGLAAGLEGGYLVIYPLLPGFRRRCEGGWARDAQAAARDALRAQAAHLSENARSRLTGIERRRDAIINQLRARPDGASLLASWQPRLDELVHEALRILVAIDALPPNPRAEAFAQTEVERLEKELADAQPGPAREAKQARLAHLRARAQKSSSLAEQHEAAAVQLDTLEDLLEELEQASIEGRDAAAFAGRLEQVSALVEATRQSVRALDAALPVAAELSDGRRA